MTTGIVTPTSTMCAAPSAATVTGQRRRPRRRAAPVSTASHSSHHGESRSLSTPTLRTSSRETQAEDTDGRGPQHVGAPDPGPGPLPRVADPEPGEQARPARGGVVRHAPSLGARPAPAPPPRGGWAAPPRGLAWPPWPPRSRSPPSRTTPHRPVPRRGSPAARRRWSPSSTPTRSGRRGSSGSTRWSARHWARGCSGWTTSARRRCRDWPPSRWSTPTSSSPTPTTSPGTCRPSRRPASCCGSASPGGTGTACCGTRTPPATSTSSAPTVPDRGATGSSATGSGPTTRTATATPPPSAQASDAAVGAGEHAMQYNARKEQVLRDIARRALTAAGLPVR